MEVRDKERGETNSVRRDDVEAGRQAGKEQGSSHFVSKSRQAALFYSDFIGGQMVRGGNGWGALVEKEARTMRVTTGKVAMVVARKIVDQVAPSPDIILYVPKIW